MDTHTHAQTGLTWICCCRRLILCCCCRSCCCCRAIWGQRTQHIIRTYMQYVCEGVWACVCVCVCFGVSAGPVGDATHLQVSEAPVARQRVDALVWNIKELISSGLSSQPNGQQCHTDTLTDTYANLTECTVCSLSCYREGGQVKSVPFF